MSEEPPKGPGGNNSGRPTDPEDELLEVLRKKEALLRNEKNTVIKLQTEARDNYNAALSSGNKTEAQLAAASADYSADLQRSIQGLQDLMENVENEVDTYGIEKKNKKKELENKKQNLLKQISAEIAKSLELIKRTGIDPHENLNQARENTPSKKVDRIKSGLDTISTDAINTYQELYKILSDKEGKGKLDDVQKEIYKLRLKNLEVEFNTKSLELDALVAAGSISAEKSAVLEGKVTSSKSLFEKISKLIENNREATLKPEVKLDNLAESASKLELLLGTIDADIEKKIEEKGELKASEKKSIYNQLLTQAVAIRKIRAKIEGIEVEAGSIEYFVQQNTHLKLNGALDRLKEIDKSLDKKKKIDSGKIIKEAVASIGKADDFQDGADKVMHAYRDARAEREVSMTEALKMRRAGLSSKEIQEEQRRRLANPEPKLKRSEKRQAMNDYKRAFRELKFAKEKLEVIYHSEDFYDLPDDQQTEVRKKLIEIKDQRRKINQSVGVLVGDALSPFDKGFLAGERMADSIADWFGMPQKPKEKAEEDWRKGLPTIDSVAVITPIISSESPKDGDNSGSGPSTPPPTPPAPLATPVTPSPLSPTDNTPEPAPLPTKPKDEIKPEGQKETREPELSPRAWRDINYPNELKADFKNELKSLKTLFNGVNAVVYNDLTDLDTLLLSVDDVVVDMDVVAGSLNEIQNKVAYYKNEASALNKPYKVYDDALKIIATLQQRLSSITRNSSAAPTPEPTESKSNTVEIPDEKPNQPRRMHPKAWVNPIPFLNEDQRKYLSSRPDLISQMDLALKGEGGEKFLALDRAEQEKFLLDIIGEIPPSAPSAEGLEVQEIEPENIIMETPPDASVSGSTREIEPSKQATPEKVEEMPQIAFLKYLPREYITFLSDHKEVTQLFARSVAAKIGQFVGLKDSDERKAFLTKEIRRIGGLNKLNIDALPR